MADSTVTRVVLPGQTAVRGGGGGDGQIKPEYIAFVLVPVFFLLGLLGVLICHVLKRKGYRCTTEAEDEEEAAAAAKAAEDQEKDLEMCAELNNYSESNNDTVGQIVHYIMQNEANSDALKAMINENSDGLARTPTSPTPPVTPISPGSSPWAAKHTCNHQHTIGGMQGHKYICNRCNHKKWPLMRRVPTKRIADRRSQGEVTVLAVGRFRVTKCDKERPARERRTLLITDSNGSVPTSPTETEPLKSRSSSVTTVER